MLKERLKEALAAALGPTWQSNKLIVAVSGGMDSMVLGDLLASIYPANQIVIAHVNHQRRGEASDLDENLVVDYFQKKNLLVERTRASREGRDAASEDGMRQLRRAFFEEMRGRLQADYICTAHHSNDQLETLLMRLLRGTGLEGLSSMSAVRGHYLKPMLSFTKKEIGEHASAFAIPFREDSTNSETFYFRNQIRHELVPQFLKLGSHFGNEQALLARVTDLTEELSRHAALVDSLAESWMDINCIRSRFWTRMSLVEWLKLRPPVAEKVLRDIVRTLGGETPSREALNRLMVCLKANQRGAELEGKIHVRQSCGYVYFQNAEQRLLLRSERRFEKTEAGFVCEDLGLEFKVESSELGSAEMRFFAPGDVYRRTKLKKLLLTRRVPSPERSLLPVLARRGSNELLWYFPQASHEVKAQRLDFPFSVRS